jgi:hypothetical protein
MHKNPVQNGGITLHDRCHAEQGQFVLHQSCQGICQALRKRPSLLLLDLSVLQVRSDTMYMTLLLLALLSFSLELLSFCSISNFFWAEIGAYSDTTVRLFALGSHPDLGLDVLPTLSRFSGLSSWWVGTHDKNVELSPIAASFKVVWPIGLKRRKAVWSATHLYRLLHLQRETTSRGKLSKSTKGWKQHHWSLGSIKRVLIVVTKSWNSYDATPWSRPSTLARLG